MADQTDTTATETSTTATTDTGGTNDAGATQAPAAGDPPAATDDGTILATATAEPRAGDKPSADSAAAPTPTPVPDDVPETYELKPFKVGEGDAAQEISIDSSLLEAVTPGLKEAGVKQSQLDKLAPLVPAIQEATLKQLNDEFSATRAGWAKEAQDDPEIGGKNFSETQSLAGKALDHFGAPSEIKEVDGKKVETNEFRKLLNESGLGNHPVMLKMFRNIGASLSEDGTFVRNTTEQTVAQSREQKNYPEDQPK